MKIPYESSRIMKIVQEDSLSIAFHELNHVLRLNFTDDYDEAFANFVPNKIPGFVRCMISGWNPIFRVFFIACLISLAFGYIWMSMVLSLFPIILPYLTGKSKNSKLQNIYNNFYGVFGKKTMIVMSMLSSREIENCAKRSCFYDIMYTNYTRKRFIKSVIKYKKN